MEDLFSAQEGVAVLGRIVQNRDDRGADAPPVVHRYELRWRRHWMLSGNGGIGEQPPIDNSNGDWAIVGRSEIRLDDAIRVLEDLSVSATVSNRLASYPLVEPAPRLVGRER